LAAPDVVEPVVGWRVWDVVVLDGAYRLCSLAFFSIWLPERETAAACRRAWVEGSAVLAPHAAPAERCTCGIYGTRTVRQTLAYSRSVRRRGDTVHRVVGRVSLWGRVVESDAGWRAAYGYPSTLVVPARWARRDRRQAPVEEVVHGLAAYGVPVDLVDARGERELAALLEPDVQPL
jgi:hypothetical protein